MKRETEELKKLRVWLEETENLLKDCEDENSPVRPKVTYICNKLARFNHEFYQLFGDLFSPYNDHKTWTFEHFEPDAQGTDYYNNVRLTAAWLFYHMVRADGIEFYKEIVSNED